MLQKLKASGISLKWAIDLSQPEVNFKPHITIKGQTLADFIFEFTYQLTLEFAKLGRPSKKATSTNY